MIRGYISRRLLQVPLTCAGILLLGFLLIHLAPGDPVLALAGDSGDADYYAFMQDKFDLDEPLPVQLAAYAGNVITGDLGMSFVQGRPVSSIIGERLPATLLLSGTALVLSTAVGVAMGTWGASRPGGTRDLVVSATSLALYAAPVFWLGQLAIIGLAVHLGWFPVQGMTSARGGGTGLAAVGDVLHHLALPALVLASQEVAAISRLTRSGLADEMGTDHVRTARSKGVGEVTVLVRHGLRRPLLPVTTVVGGRIGHLVAGTVVVETVFGWPGIGRLLITSVQARDIPVVLGIFLLVALTVVIVNLITDLVYGWLDPRIRLR